jgi:hypothetical protein
VIEDTDKVLAIFGLKLINAVAAAFVSFASLRFWKGLDLGDKWMTFLGGWALAAWGAPPLRSYFALKEEIEIGIVLLIAFFGIAVSAELVNLLRTTDWKALALSVIPRKPGG